MKGKMNTEYGEVLIDEAVIAKYAGTTAIECFGIVGMASVSVADGIVKLLKKDSLTKGIDVTFGEKNELTIDFHVIVSYGVSISAVADNLVSNVKYKVEDFTGLKVSKINVIVEGVRVID
ncbi:MAG: Asp23/Gls24 family envelope stress response protein [Lachnospiraceae bacterium]|nr:Asp23/Gls24 family envelope stress response protein [Lachnospiraceae bacterium]